MAKNKILGNHLDHNVPNKSEEADEEFSEAAEMYSRRIYILLYKGHFEGARAVIDEAQQEFNLLKNKVVTLDSPVAQLNISNRTSNVLQLNGVRTVKHLLDNFSNVETFRDIGPKTMRSILLELISLGFNVTHTSKLNQ